MDDLLTEIKDYCARVGIKTSTFGRYVVGDGKLVSRLEAGNQIMPRTMERVRAYMRDNPEKALRPKAKEGTA